MSRRGICLIWFRGRHIPPSMPYREARSVAESSEGPTASKSDRTGRNPGMTRLVRRSSATSGGTVVGSVVNMAVYEWSCLSGLSVDDLQHLPIQFGQVLKAKNFNRCGVLPVGVGGPTLRKKISKWESVVFLCDGMAEFPRTLLGMSEATWKHETGWSAARAKNW